MLTSAHGFELMVATQVPPELSDLPCASKISSSLPLLGAGFGFLSTALGLMLSNTSSPVLAPGAGCCEGRFARAAPARWPPPLGAFFSARPKPDGGGSTDGGVADGGMTAGGGALLVVDGFPPATGTRSACKRTVRLGSCKNSWRQVWYWALPLISITCGPGAMREAWKLVVAWVPFSSMTKG